MKSLIKINKIMFPKKTSYVPMGEFAIFSANIIEHLEGEKPKVDRYWETIKLKGNVPEMKEGDSFICVYDEGETNKYGTTYNIKSIGLDIDEKDPTQLYSFLVTVCGKQITETLKDVPDAYKMLKEKNTEELIKIKYITEKKLERIYEKMEVYGDFAKAFSELSPFGLSNNLILLLCKSYGSADVVIDLCKTNPYAFIDKVKGVGFQKADEIAMKCALDMKSETRIKYLILFCLEEEAKNGKTYMLSHQLIQQVDKVISVDFEKLNTVINNLVKENRIKLLNDNKEICLTHYFDLEKAICKELVRINNSKSTIEIPVDWKDKIVEIEQKQGWNYTEEQKQGIETVLFNNVSIVTGKAGTGKSTITNAVCSILEKYYVNMTCLSAKAAQRLEEVSGHHASTIHRLLGLRPNSQLADLKGYLQFTDIVILDESSMVNGELFLMLLTAIVDGTKLIIIGDDGQLQPIGECAVFSDLLVSGKLPIVRLTQIHRQAAKSAIITKSIDIRNQKPIYPKGFLGHDTLGELKDLDIYVHPQDSEPVILKNEVIECFKKELEKVGNILEVQIIVPIKTKGTLCTKELNNKLQEIYNPIRPFGEKYITKSESVIQVGDKVINTKNNYRTHDKEGNNYPIFNGNIGIVKEVTKDSITINFNGTLVVLKGGERKGLELAYAITIHSSQGSQWESIIIALNMSSYIMLSVELIYTAITRAIKHCDLICTTDALNKSIRTVEQNHKQTYLQKFLLYAPLKEAN